MSGNDSAANPGAWTITEGMALRDYFAGQALAGMCANQRYLEQTIEVTYKEGLVFSSAVAKTAYVMADAMLKSRDA